MEYKSSLDETMSRNPYTDITANNHGGNKQSEAANIAIAPYKLNWRERILGFMALRDAEGLGTSCRHAADHFGKEAGQIEGRFTELKSDGLIEPTLHTENGYMVYRLIESTKVAINDKPRKRCMVVGPALVGEIVVEKGTGGWQIAQVKPKALEKIVEGVALTDMNARLTALQLTYEWVKT